MPLQDYLKPEYKNSPEALEVHELFRNENCGMRMVLKVPVDVGDAITRFLKRAVDPAYTFHRRTGGGTRRDSMALTCLRRDATYFKYYFDKKPSPRISDYQHTDVVVHHCPTCGQRT